MGSSGSKITRNFPDRDAKGNFVVPALDVRAQVLSIYDRRYGVGKPVFKLAPLGHEQLFDVTAPNLCEPYISDVALQQIVSEASTRLRFARPMCDGRPFASSPFRRLASRGLFFLCGIGIWWPLLLAVYLCRYDTLTCYCHTCHCLAWQMSNHIDAIHTPTCYLQRTQYGFAAELPFLPLDLFARGAFVPRVAVGSTRRTRSAWSFTVARRRTLGSPRKRSSWSATITLATDVLQPPEVLRDQLAGNTCAHIPGWRLQMHFLEYERAPRLS